MSVLCAGKVKDNKKSTRFRKKIEYFFRCMLGMSIV